MDRKSRAARTSLVAAFIAAGGAVVSTAPAEAAAPPGPAVAPSSQLQLGDQLVRFLKLDGFPAYLKYEGFAQLGQYDKWRTTVLPELSNLYLKYEDQVDGLLALYQKGDAGPLTGILIALEQYYKHMDDEGSLTTFRETYDSWSKDTQSAYLKFETFLSDLKSISKDALAYQYFKTETGILGDPLAQTPPPNPG